MSRAFSTGHHPRAPTRIAVIADADDVARLLSDLGYPPRPTRAVERISVIADNDRQALVVARRDGAVVGLIALDFATCRWAPPPAGSPRWWSPDRAGAWASAAPLSGSRTPRPRGRRTHRTDQRRARAGRRTFYRACGYKDSSVRFVKPFGA